MTRDQGATPKSEIDRRVAAAVTPDLVSAYQSDGACCVRGLFSPDEIALLASGIESNLASPSARAIVASKPGDPGRFFEDFCNWQRIPAYRRFIEESPAAAAAAALMGGSPVRLFHDHLLVKEAGTVQRTPWHQDQPYYNVEGRQNVSMWIPVDPVAREATPEFIAASHLGPWLMPRTFMDQQAKWFPEGSLADLPDIDANPQAYDILGWALQPGDMVCFNMLTLHAAPGSATRRRAFSLRLLGADMRHAPRPWKTSPDFPGLDSELAAGAPMEHPLFPRLWPAPD
jgi:ectoine hydroxylase-related dioxygenase (phytanoyl-CoA dioxygenase family)